MDIWKPAIPVWNLGWRDFWARCVGSRQCKCTCKHADGCLWLIFWRTWLSDNQYINFQRSFQENRCAKRLQGSEIRNEKAGEINQTKTKPSRFRDLLHSNSTCSIIQLNFQSGKCRRKVWFLSIMTCKIVHALTFFPMVQKLIFNPDLKIVCFFPTSLCGVLVFGCVLPVRLPPPPPPATCPQLDHTQLTHNLLTHNLSTHNLPTHNIPTHTHNLLTHTHKRPAHNLLTHTTCSQTPGTWRQTPPLCVADVAPGVAGVAVGDIDLHFVWQAWHLVTSTFTLRGRCGTYGTGLAVVARLGLAGAAAFCVAGMALGDIDFHFAWQMWHLVTWICTLCGRRGTYGTGLAVVARLGLAGAAAFCVAGMALGDIDFHFAWQMWHLVTWICTLCGRRGMALGWLWFSRLGLAGTAALCVAGVALGDIDFHFALKAWWHLVTSTFTLRGRRGTWWHGSALCVAGVALMALGWLWWRAWVWRAPRHFAWSLLQNIFHPQHFHTRLFLTHTTFAHHTFTHTLLSPTHFHTALFHTPHFDMHFLHTPILHHLFSLSYLSHPIFTFLRLLIGRSWHVGLSGPLIFLVNSLIWPALILHPFILAHGYKTLIPSPEWKAASIAYLLDMALNILCTDGRHRL